MIESALDRIAELGLVPVVELPDAEVALPLADALVSGGLPCLEITLRTAAAVAAIKTIAGERPGVLVGAATVLTPEQVNAAVDAGARFVVSPGFDRAVVERCLERSIAVLPGVATATEVQMARACGLGAAKFFPAEAAGGPAYLRALAGPFPSFRFVPTGGIGLHNLEGYLGLAQVLAVGGSWLAPYGLLATRDLTEVERRVRESVAEVRRLRPAAPAGASS